MYSQIFLFSKNECALGLVQQTGQVLQYRHIAGFDYNKYKIEIIDSLLL